MPSLDPSSRFSSLKVFKLKSDAAPPPPPKDYALSPFYNRSLFSRSATSLSPESVSGPATPATPYPPAFDFARRSNVALATANGRAAAGSPAPSASGGSHKSFGRGPGDLLTPSMDGSTDSSGSCPNAANLDMYSLNGANASTYTMSQASTKPKKSVFKLASLARRNRSKKDLSDTASASESVSRSTSVSGKHGAEGDDGISMPWNFQHNIHVDEGYIGLPPSWTSALSQVGFDDGEIAAIHARRRAAVTGSAANSPSTERPPSPSTSASTFSNVLLEPLPRTTSLLRGRDVLAVHPPSTYSTTTGGSTIMPSPAPSPRAPSFSMRSFVSGIKNSLTSDPGNMDEGVGSSSRRGGEESEQYVFVDGDGPDDGGGQGMGEETFIEPYPFDTMSISSHQTHSSRIRQLSQGQETPRIPVFPQIQVQRTQSDAGHASAPRAPSPLAFSHSLPGPSPPRGHAHSKQTLSLSPPHSLASTRQGPTSAPPRTPPRRIYHVSNASSDSYDGTTYAEPPPAYVSPEKGAWIPKKEKEGLGIPAGLPPPNRPIPPIPTGQASRLSRYDSRDENQETFMSDTTGSSANNIPRTADEVLDISSYYTDNVDADPAQAISPTPPLVIDKRVTKLATLPPRVSLHQDSLEDWSESLFSAIGKGKRSSILVTANVKKERRTTLRPMSPLTIVGEGALETASNSLSPKIAAPTLPDMSFGANLTLGPQARATTDAVEEGNKLEQAESDPRDNAGELAVEADITETAEELVKEEDVPPAAPSAPILPDVSLGPNVSSISKDLEPPSPAPPSPPESPCSTDADSLPPSPPPKPKPKPAPLTIPPAAALALPRTNVIPGISGKSPVNPLFGVKPQPLPIPIPPSQIRAQLRPAPPKPAHPTPTLPLPPLKRLPSQVNLQPPLLPPSQLPLPPSPSPLKAYKHASAEPHVSQSHISQSGSPTLLPARGTTDRDSGLSMITVTQATIATAKTEVVRTAVASVIDSDVVSLAPKRESVVSTADAEPDTLAYDEPDMGEESLRTREREEVPDDSLLISETSSASLLRDGPQSKWPTPPPPPVELEATPRRVSRFRTTSLGRVSQLQAMAASPIGSHFSNRSWDTMSSSNSTRESSPVATPKGMNGVGEAGKTKGLAPETRFLSSTAGTFGGVHDESEGEEEEEGTQTAELMETARTSSAHPLLAQLQPYISPRDPAACFTHLVEIAEGESGSVFAARVAPDADDAQDTDAGVERHIPPGTSHVAIKRIPLPSASSSPCLSDDAPISNKLVSVLHELCVLKGLEHEHLLLLDGVYVGSGEVDSSVWIRMELMERSLADVIGLVAEGLALQERLIARFASDVLHGLDYLQRQHIAHRDVRSDNLLVNASGVVKLADFSNAIRVDRNVPTVNGAVGVIYWQAPEMRAGPYNALKVDAWSLGATVWELAETVPPFSTPPSPSTQVSFVQTARRIGSQWPPLTHPEHYSRQFHEFLKLCGRESAGRPSPGELLNTPFVRNACGRAVILQLLAQCRSIEETMAAQES